ncbi:GNAT family N-acetyltransferase [Candidatus Micrarchaeota archaeon]|nr:GNAT family N-acetyltransferase [Candidatus Micrarchaeota archaeon]
MEEFSAKDVRITRASQKQLYSITVMTRRYFPYTNFSMDAILKRLKKKNVIYFVALYKGHTIGFVDIEFKKDYAKILGLAVLEEFRSNGIGSKLLKKALACIKLRKKKSACMLVAVDNQAALRLYARYGFKVRGRLYRKINGKGILLVEKNPKAGDNKSQTKNKQ